MARTVGTPRVHGNGFVLQDLDDGSRLHVWHHSIPRQSQDTSIHDHRFSFRSRVLEGTMVNVGFWFWPRRPGEDRTCTHRVYLVDSLAGEETRLRLCETSATGYLQPGSTHLWAEGEEYNWGAARLHLSVPLGLTVTRIFKTGTHESYSPRVLCPIGREPDNTWVRGTTRVPDWVRDVVRRHL